MLTKFKSIYDAVVEWVERGDLVPLIILVSVPHYISVMVAFEYWPVAFAMGVLADLGHYRTILVYLKSSVGRFGSLFWMLVLTGISYGFHVGFYTISGFVPHPWTWIIGAVPPILIFAMAYISKREKWYLKKAPKSGESSELPQSGTKYNYRHLSDEDKAALRGLTARQIQSKYPGMSEKTSHNWRKKASTLVS